MSVALVAATHLTPLVPATHPPAVSASHCPPSQQASPGPQVRIRQPRYERRQRHVAPPTRKRHCIASVPVLSDRGQVGWPATVAAEHRCTESGRRRGCGGAQLTQHAGQRLLAGEAGTQRKRSAHSRNECVAVRDGLPGPQRGAVEGLLPPVVRPIRPAKVLRTLELRRQTHTMRLASGSSSSMKQTALEQAVQRHRDAFCPSTALARMQRR